MLLVEGRRAPEGRRVCGDGFDFRDGDRVARRRHGGDLLPRPAVARGEHRIADGLDMARFRSVVVAEEMGFAAPLEVVGRDLDTPHHGDADAEAKLDRLLESLGGVVVDDSDVVEAPLLRQ